MNRNRMLATAVGVGLPLTFLSGCAASVEDVDECNVYNAEGERVHPLSYPLGEITVHYTYKDYVNGKKSTTGVINKQGSSYVLDVKGMPSVSELGIAKNFVGERFDVAVSIFSAETGDLGFTTGCIQSGKDSAGLPTTLIELPLE